jgi:hypothetical protein
VRFRGGPGVVMHEWRRRTAAGRSETQAGTLSMRSFSLFARRAVNNTTNALIPAPV